MSFVCPTASLPCPGPHSPFEKYDQVWIFSNFFLRLESTWGPASMDLILAFPDVIVTAIYRKRVFSKISKVSGPRGLGLRARPFEFWPHFLAGAQV